MKRFLVFASLALLPLAAPSSANAASARSFVGLWEGIDPVDGGDSLRSITCSEDRSCQLAATDSIITLCGGGAGFVGATGALETVMAGLAFRDGWVPGTANLVAPEPELAALLPGLLHEGRPGTYGRILSTSFGFGGLNAALVFGAADG